MANENNKNRLMEHFFEEMCACVQLYQYIKTFEKEQYAFGMCIPFYFDLMRMLKEALIVRLYCLLDKEKGTAKIENIYETVLGKSMLNNADLEDMRGKISLARNNFIAHKNKTGVTEGIIAIKNGSLKKTKREILQNAFECIPNAFEILSGIYTELKGNDDVEFHFEGLISTADICFIDTLSLGAGLLEDKGQSFSSCEADNIINHLRRDARLRNEN